MSNSIPATRVNLSLTIFHKRNKIKMKSISISFFEKPKNFLKMVKKLEELIKYQGQLPDKLEVQITKSDDWGYAIKILNLPGCFTQVENAEELFVMVNDAVYTYFDIPNSVIPSMPRYLSKS